MKSISSLLCLVSILIGASHIAEARSVRRSESKLDVAIAKADRLANMLSRRGHRLRDGEISQILNQINASISIVRGERLPPRDSRTCSLMGYGGYGSFNYKYRVAVDGKIVDAHNNLSDALKSISDLKKIGSCDDLPYASSDSTCELKGYGGYGSFNYKYRLTIEGRIIYASNVFGEIESTLNQLNSSNLCAAEPVSRCEFLGAGGYGSFNYKFRVAIGSSIISGHSSRGEAIAKLEKLRDLNFCY